MKQLQENFDSAEVVLSVEVLEKIEAVHKVYPNPGLDAVISCQRFHAGMFVIAAFRTKKSGQLPAPIRLGIAPRGRNKTCCGAAIEPNRNNQTSEMP